MIACADPTAPIDIASLVNLEGVFKRQMRPPSRGNRFERRWIAMGRPRRLRAILIERRRLVLR